MDQHKEKLFRVKLKDFDGKICHELQMTEPLMFPYLFWEGRLFVTSRDEVNTLLERSFYILK